MGVPGLGVNSVAAVRPKCSLPHASSEGSNPVAPRWALFDCSYKGAQLRISSKPGRWAADVASDEGQVGYKASGPTPICHGEGPGRVMLQEPKSDFYFERRLVM